MEQKRYVVDLRDASEEERVQISNDLHNNGFVWKSGHRMDYYTSLLDENSDAIQLYFTPEETIKKFVLRGNMSFYSRHREYKHSPIKTKETVKYLFNNK